MCIRSLCTWCTPVVARRDYPLKGRSVEGRLVWDHTLVVEARSLLRRPPWTQYIRSRWRTDTSDRSLERQDIGPQPVRQHLKQNDQYPDPWRSQSRWSQTACHCAVSIGIELRFAIHEGTTIARYTIPQSAELFRYHNRWLREYTC